MSARSSVCHNVVFLGSFSVVGWLVDVTCEMSVFDFHERGSWGGGFHVENWLFFCFAVLCISKALRLI